MNFTGTAGEWRASAIEAAGGWRAASLVEDCEFTFRHLFAECRTKFVREFVVSAELSPTFTAYKAQQRRSTQCWVQLQRLHTATLLFRSRCSRFRRLHLQYHMCTSWQWPASARWITALPIMLYTNHWYGSLGLAVGASMYVMPTALFVIVAAAVAPLETKHTYPGRITPHHPRDALRSHRVVPRHQHWDGPHQFTAFAEGLFGPPHSEFFVRVQLGWAARFAAHGLVLCAIGATYVASCVAGLCYFYGDHIGKRCLVLDRPPRAAGDVRRTVQAPDAQLLADFQGIRIGCRTQTESDSPREQRDE